MQVASVGEIGRSGKQDPNFSDMCLQRRWSLKTTQRSPHSIPEFSGSSSEDSHIGLYLLQPVVSKSYNEGKDRGTTCTALRATLQNRFGHVRPRHRLTKLFLVLENGLDLLQQLPLIFLLSDGLHGVPCLAYGRDERRELCIHNAFDHQPRRTISDGSSPFSRDLQTETSCTP